MWSSLVFIGCCLLKTSVVAGWFLCFLLWLRDALSSNHRETLKRCRFYYLQDLEITQITRHTWATQQDLEWVGGCLGNGPGALLLLDVREGPWGFAGSLFIGGFKTCKSRNLKHGKWKQTVIPNGQLLKSTMISSTKEAPVEGGGSLSSLLGPVCFIQGSLSLNWMPGYPSQSLSQVLALQKEKKWCLYYTVELLKVISWIFQAFSFHTNPPLCVLCCRFVYSWGIK